MTAPDVSAELSEQTILCLPVGSFEQHGPHLPLNTDTVIAEQFTALLVDRYADHHDLWALPAIPYGLSLEHAWSPGTISLRIATFTSILDAVVAEYARATPARNLLIINGHGGNRGILEAALYEIERTHHIRACVIHPSSLSTFRVESELPEVHAGLRETSVMLALAPEDVHLSRTPQPWTSHGEMRDAIRRMVLDRGTTWPWSSADNTIASHGVIGGDPHAATAEIGQSIITSALEASADVLARLTTAHR